MGNVTQIDITALTPLALILATLAIAMGGLFMAASVFFPELAERGKEVVWRVVGGFALMAIASGLPGVVATVMGLQ